MSAVQTLSWVATRPLSSHLQISASPARERGVSRQVWLLCVPAHCGTGLTCISHSRAGSGSQPAAADAI